MPHISQGGGGGSGGSGGTGGVPQGYVDTKVAAALQSAKEYTDNKTPVVLTKEEVLDTINKV